MTYDITEPQDLRTESATVIHEMDHRIKNHLQLLASYARLASQRRGLTAGELAEDLAEKLGAIAGAHDALHRSGGLQSVPALPFLHTLVAAFPQDPHPILIDCDADLQLPARELGPIGMIVSEAVANALKHAFPKGLPGCVWVSLSQGMGTVRLTVRDNGVGLLELKTGRISGRGLIEALSRQLGANTWARTMPEGGAEVGVTYARREAAA